MLRALKCDFSKTILNIGFVGAVFVTFILCFSVSAYLDLNQKSYSVFEVIMSGMQRELTEIDFSCTRETIFTRCISGYVQLFIPIIVAFPFMTTFCAERNSGLMRFTITRTGKIKYSVSKFISCIFSAGLAVMLGTALFGIVIFFIFPSATELGKETTIWLFPKGVAVFYLKTIMEYFCYGAISAMPAFFISSFCKNPYIVTCLPFLFVYVWDSILDKIWISTLNSDNPDLHDKIRCFRPYSIQEVFGNEFNQVAKTALIFNIIYVVLFFAAFVFIMNMRKDKGV